MAKLTKAGVKGTPKKRPYKKRSQLNGETLDQTETFEIDENPPIFVRGATPEKIKMFNKLEKTLLTVRIGQAFIIPAEFHNMIERYLKLNYTTERFGYYKIPDNPNAVRVYRLGPPLPKLKTKK